MLAMRKRRCGLDLIWSRVAGRLVASRALPRRPTTDKRHRTRSAASLSRYPGGTWLRSAGVMPCKCYVGEIPAIASQVTRRPPFEAPIAA